MHRDKIVLVTGGASGIGLATAKKFLKNNFTVIVIDINRTDLNNLKDTNIKTYYADVTSPKSIKNIFQEINREYQYIDILVSNAGRAFPEEFNNDLPTFDIWQKSIELNLSSHYNVILNSLELLKNGTEKSIVLNSSINAISSYGLIAYSSAKSGLLGLMISLSQSIGRKHNIRINTVLPGTVKPSKKEKFEDKNYDLYEENSILKKMATENEIGTVIYSVAYEFTHMTGQKVIIDGGQTIFNSI